MTEKLISRRDAFSLLGLAAALALPTTALTTSGAEAQVQPATPARPATPAQPAPAPTTPAPTTATPTAPATPGMTRRQARHNARQMRREARRNARHMRHEARHNARQMRRQARRGMYMRANTPAKQPQ